MPRYSFGPYVAASAWTEDDLARWRTCIALLRRYERFEVEIACEHCRQSIRRTIRLADLRDAARFLEQKLGQVGRNATPWFR